MNNIDGGKILLLAAVIAVAALAVAVKPIILLAILLCLAILLFFMKFLTLGLYLIVLLYPFIYFQLFIGREINVPYVDVLAMFVFAAWTFKTLYLWLAGRAKWDWSNLPGFPLFLAFIIASALSLLNVEDLQLSIKYLLRPLIFFYLMFVLLPFNLIKTPKILFRVFWAFFIVGIFVALMGLWSMLFPEISAVFRRAVPIAIAGIYPLGTNHNLIAEVLVSIIPLAVILYFQAKDLQLKTIVGLSLGLMAAINLLTFSRTGWLVLFFEAIIFVLIFYNKQIRQHWKIGLAIVLVILPLFYLMLNFLNTPIVRSSNLNRVALTQISLHLWERHPWIGRGVGTFMEEVGGMKWYLVDYGSPEEAHGVIQKLLAESGIFGLTTFFALIFYALFYMARSFRQTANPQWRLIIFCCFLTALGGVIFQLFNTAYFVSKLWLPIGVGLAAAKLARRHSEERSDEESPCNPGDPSLRSG